MLAFLLPAVCAGLLIAPTVASASTGHAHATHASKVQGLHAAAKVHGHASQAGNGQNGGNTSTSGGKGHGHGAGGPANQPKRVAAGQSVATPLTSSPTAPPSPRAPQSVVRSGFVSAVSAAPRSTRRGTTPAFTPGSPVLSVTPPSPSTAPVVIGSGGVIGPAPLVLGTQANWVPLIVVLLLLCLVVLALILTSRRRRRVDLPPPPLAGHF